jgi:hypothetical protein
VRAEPPTISLGLAPENQLVARYMAPFDTLADAWALDVSSSA